MGARTHLTTLFACTHTLPAPSAGSQHPGWAATRMTRTADRLGGPSSWSAFWLRWWAPTLSSRQLLAGKRVSAYSQKRPTQVCVQEGGYLPPAAATAAGRWRHLPVPAPPPPATSCFAPPSLPAVPDLPLPLPLHTAGAAGKLASTAAAAQPRSDMIEVQAILELRVCGSPAVDGYAHVKPECLQASPTNQWWQEHKPKPDDLDIHIERAADYDGLAGEAERAQSVCRGLWGCLA